MVNVILGLITGVDLSKEQWGKVAELIRLKNLFPFFDCAYQVINNSQCPKF